MGTTLQESLDWLDEAREADADRGSPGRMLAQCSLPRTDQGKLSHYVRANGLFPLAMTAVGTPRLPYGNLLRLLLALVCSEAGRTGRRNLMFGKSLLEFMGRVGNNNDSVHRRRLRNQMERLVSCAVSPRYRRDDKSVRLAGMIADKAVFWWDYDRVGLDSLVPSEILLSQPRFDSIVRQPIPIDLNCLHTLRRSTSGLDFYLWLTYRAFSLADPLAWTWAQVYAPHGPFPEKTGDNVTVEAFRKTCLAELMKINRAWPDLNYTTERAMAAHSPPDTGVDPRRSKSRTPTPECASYVSTARPTLLQVTAGPPAFQNRFIAPSFTRVCGCLQPLARPLIRLAGASLPPELLRSPNGASVIALPMPPWRGPALGSASSSPLSGLAVAASPG